MTWFSHKIITFSVLFAFTNSFWFAIISAIGSVIPDLLEGKGFLSNDQYKYEKWRKNHRKITHWLIPYAIIGVMSLMVFKKNPFTFSPTNILNLNSDLISWSIFTVCTGAIFHILQDAISGKVPLLNPNKKTFGIRLIPTRSMFEFIFVFLIIFITFLAR